MTKRLQEVRTASAPKRKFAFMKSSFPIPTTGTFSPPVAGTPGFPKEIKRLDDGASEVAPTTQKSWFAEKDRNPGFRLSSLASTHYVLKQSPSDRMSMASLADIQGSVIDLSIAPSVKTSLATLMVTNIRGSLLLCGTVLGSAHITGVKDSTIVITARQIRIHDCKNCVVYLQCSSRPIIEDCKEIRFAPLPASMVRLTIPIVIQHG